MSPAQTKTLALLSALSCAALLFVFLPSEIYARNPLEFVTSQFSILTQLLAAALLTALVLWLPVWLPFPRWQKAWAALLGALFIALWVSSVFLVVDFGMLDGTRFDLSEHARTLTFHSVYFLLVLAASLFAVWRWPVYLGRGISFIGAGLVLIAGMNFYVTERSEGSQSRAIDLTEVTRFSSKSNLLIVLMDTFQSDVLHYLLEQDPALAEELDGFVFYPDTLGVAPSTYLTMPAVHSGSSYDLQLSLSEYYDLGVRRGSFLSELARKGYQVDLINPIAGACPDDVNICRGQAGLLSHADEELDAEVSRLADLSLFRAFPGLSKHWVFDGSSGPITRWRQEVALAGLEEKIYRGNTVQNLLAENLWVDNGPPTARLVHLFNTHPPYMFNQDCEFIGVVKAMDQQHMRWQIDCAMQHFRQLISALKDQQAYDNTLIILTADTGVGNIYGADDLSSTYAQEHGLKPGEFGRLIGGANPVLAIKFPAAQGPLRESGVQAQLSDIPQTVCTAMGDCSIEAGINLRDAEPSQRSRIYHYYRFKHEYWGLDHIPGIVTYSVNGPLWLKSSWVRQTERTPPKQVATVHFSDEDEEDLFGFGWSYPEVNEEGITKRWSNAEQAELFLNLPGGRDLALEFQVLSAPGLDGQEMRLSLNGEVLGSRQLDNRVQNITFEAPAALLNQPVSELLLEFAQVLEPESADQRTISVSFYELTIYPLAEPEKASKSENLKN